MDIAKKCTICGKLKTLEDFYNKKNGVYGKHSHCKDCLNKNSREKHRNKKPTRKCALCAIVKSTCEFPELNKMGVCHCNDCIKEQNNLSIENNRKCKYCRKIKNLNEFQIYQKNITYVCNKCSSFISGKNSKKRHFKNPARRIFTQAKKRAKLNNLDFDIELLDIIVPKFCPVLGLKLEPANHHANNNSPTLDRINSKLGYVKGNIRVISWRANKLKNDGVLEEFECIVKYMKDNGV